jgi:hypothetical protein
MSDMLVHGGDTSMDLNKSGENLWVLLIALSIRREKDSVSTVVSLGVI